MHWYGMHNPVKPIKIMQNHLELSGIMGHAFLVKNL